MRIITIFIFSMFTISVNAQFINGYITDTDTKRPLKDVIISVSELNINVESDSIGFWSMQIPTGTYSVRFQLLGYESIIVSDVSVSAGKQRDLSVDMKELLTILEEVVITPDGRSYGQISRMRINPSELSHIPGNARDPIRMLTSMPGITNTGDDRNDLVVRGNTSIGVLWRIEGIEVFNPNHYVSSGATGGAISLLNKDILGASYFYTGAFPAEFGNVFSGVFDANFREGNANKYEFSAEVSNLNLNLIAEGPIPIKKRKSSFVAGFRQSVIPVFDIINKKYRELLLGATPVVTDFSFKLTSRNKIGAKTVFWGMVGKSDINVPAYTSSNTSSFEISNHTFNASAGLSHQFFIGKKVNIKALLGASYLKINNASIWHNNMLYKDQFVDRSKSASIGTVSDIKLNSNNVLKNGINIRFMDLNTEEILDNQYTVYSTPIHEKVNTINAFSEWKHNFNHKLSLTSGIHYFMFSLNKHYRVEPRISLTYSLRKYNFELALGEYSKQNPIGLYMAEVRDSFPNTNLDFIKSRQIVFSIGRNLLHRINYKLELYYQYHYDVAISKQIDEGAVTVDEGFLSSALNLSYNSGDIRQRGIVYDNTGKGYSTGIEGIIYFDDIQGFSMNISGTVLKSMYYCRKGWYNTLFNNSFAFKAFMGKNFQLNNKLMLRTNFAINWFGGRRYTPVDCDLSYTNHYGMNNINDINVYYDYSRYSEKRYSDYFRADFKASLILNMKSSTHIFAVDIRNLTNYNNIYHQGSYFQDGLIVDYTINQLKIFPVVSYQVLFGGSKP